MVLFFQVFVRLFVCLFVGVFVIICYIARLYKCMSTE